MFWWGLLIGLVITIWVVTRYISSKEDYENGLKDNDGQRINVDFIDSKIEEYIKYLENEYKKSHKENLKGEGLIKTIDYIAFDETNRRELKLLNKQINKILTNETYTRDAKNRLHLAWFDWLERETTYRKDSIYYSGEDFDNLLESLTDSLNELNSALKTFGYDQKQEREKINKKVIQEIKKKKNENKKQDLKGK